MGVQGHLIWLLRPSSPISDGAEAKPMKSLPDVKANGNMSPSFPPRLFSTASLLSKPLMTNRPSASTHGSQFGKAIRARVINSTGFSSRFGAGFGGSAPNDKSRSVPEVSILASKSRSSAASSWVGSGTSGEKRAA